MLDVLPGMLPGFIVQFPAGKPFNITEPVVTIHVGCVIVPTVGAAGAAGAALMCTLIEGVDAHTPLLTVNV